MRRRSLAALGSFAVAGALALPLALPAHAAVGALVVNGRPFYDPSGCVQVDNAYRTHLINDTDTHAVVFPSGECRRGPDVFLPSRSERVVDTFDGRVAIEFLE